jgi:hypothetical protein
LYLNYFNQSRTFVCAKKNRLDIIQDELDDIDDSDLTLKLIVDDTLGCSLQLYYPFALDACLIMMFFNCIFTGRIKETKYSQDVLELKFLNCW